MGTVFEARHRGTGRLVAVKLIADGAAAGSADIVRRFQREAMATGAIQSQYIAHALDTGIDPQTGSPYLVMDLLDGEDLQHSIASLGALPPELALRIAAQTCLGLQKAHEAGVVHRDIKPGNLFLAKREGTEIVVKLLDFGIAKVKMESITSAPAGQMTRTGSMLGSPVYMSPEQARGKKTIDHRTDLWSLGVVLYEALAGVTPHAGAETLGDLIFQICGEPPRPIQEPAPWVPAAVAAVVHRALALDPAHRFASARDMFDAIQALLPSGYALDQSMFVPLSREARSVLATHHSIPGNLRAPALSVVSSPSLNPDAVGPVKTSTTAGFASSMAAGTQGRSWTRALSFGAVAVLGVAAGAFAMQRHPTPAGSTTGLAASAPSPVTNVAATSEPDKPAAPAVPPAATASAPVPQAGESPAPARPDSLGPRAPATGSPAANAPPPPPAPRPAARTPTASPSKGASQTPKPDCSPPFTFDAKGTKVWKPECF